MPFKKSSRALRLRPRPSVYLRRPGTGRPAPATEVQQLVLENTFSSGNTFTLSLGSVTTGAIPYSSNNIQTRQNIEDALNVSLPGLFTVTTTADPFVFNFASTLVNTDLPTMTVTRVGVPTTNSVFNTTTQGRGNEVQTLTVGGAAAGTFSLSPRRSGSVHAQCPRGQRSADHAEQECLAVDGGQFRLRFNGVQGLHPPTAAGFHGSEVFDSLRTIVPDWRMS
jgi:hypothetical protein